MASNNYEFRLVEKNEMESFMKRCMLAVKTNPDHANSLAACLIAADYRGHFSHGLNRLGNVTLIIIFLMMKDVSLKFN